MDGSGGEARKGAISNAEKKFFPVVERSYVYLASIGLLLGLFSYVRSTLKVALDAVLVWIKPAIDLLEFYVIKYITPHATELVILTLLIVIFELARRRRRDSTRARVAVQILKNSHNLHLGFVKEVDRILASLERPELTDEMERQAELLAEPYLCRLCDGLSQTFAALTGRSCHGTFKVFDSSSGEVTTIARDQLAHNLHRSETDRALEGYPYTNNSAFKTILDNPSANRYHSNHLKWRAALGLYKNGNRAWRKSYSATMVIPVSDQGQPGAISRDTVLGFLCVDSRAGCFGGQVQRAFLSAYASICMDAMEKLEALQVGIEIKRDTLANAHNL
jgi:hypothetical protein